MHLSDHAAEKCWNFLVKSLGVYKKVLSCEIWTRLFNQSKRNQNNKLTSNPGLAIIVLWSLDCRKFLNKIHTYEFSICHSCFLYKFTTKYEAISWNLFATLRNCIWKQISHRLTFILIIYFLAGTLWLLALKPAKYCCILGTFLQAGRM